MNCSLSRALSIGASLLALSACSGTGITDVPTSAASNAAAIKTTAPRTMMDESADVYSTNNTRPLNSGDDQEWWDNGGSYGLVSGSSGSGCKTNVCPNSGTYKVHGGHSASGGGATPLLGGIPTIVLTCTYVAKVFGVHDPTQDTLLGCTYVDFYGATQDLAPPGNPQGMWGFDHVAIHGGKPRDGQTCNGSTLSVGDNLDTDSNGNIISVTDINSVMDGSTTVGWMYLGSNGTRYYQPNGATGTSISLNVSLGFISGSFSPPATFPPHVWNGSLPPGARPLKCFTGGKSLVG